MAAAAAATAHGSWGGERRRHQQLVGSHRVGVDARRMRVDHSSFAVNTAFIQVVVKTRPSPSVELRLNRRLINTTNIITFRRVATRVLQLIVHSEVCRRVNLSKVLC